MGNANAILPSMVFWSIGGTEIPNPKHQITNKSQIPILKLPASSCRESSKCKVFIPFYCSSLANPAPAAGNALAGAFSMTKTRNRFGILKLGPRPQGGESKRSADNFGHCYLFVICDLEFLFLQYSSQSLPAIPPRAGLTWP